MKRVLRILCPLMLITGMAVINPSLQAAERVSMQAIDPTVLQQVAGKSLAAGVGQSAPSLQQALALDSNNTFHLLRQNRDPSGKTHARYEQRFKGVPVYGEQVLVHSDAGGRVQALTGAAVDGIENDVTDNVLLNPAISSQAAMRQAKQQVRRYQASVKGVAPAFRNEKIKLVIYLDSKQVARLAWYINYVAEVVGGNPVRPYFIIDATDGRILKTWNGMAHAQIGTGPGGNEKSGLIEYGSAGVPFLDVTKSGSTCAMQTGEVRTVNLSGGFSATEPFRYSCPRNVFTPVNGGYAPLNDAHFYASVTNEMYKSYVGATPLSGALILRVHYGTKYDNAFWDGTYTNFGDGDTLFYPMSTSLNVVAHEASHGTTEQNSGLEYFGQSGGINESYSDIAGEAAEYYLNGRVDWLVGANVMKGKTKALRYFENPTKDKKSIKHAGDYYDGLDVHYSSGVFNRAYYLLSNTANWNPQKAFQVFYWANVNYWTPLSGYVDAACGVLSATEDLAFNKMDVDKAFKMVGVNCPAPLVDVDGDYMDDNWEIEHGLNTSINDSAEDSDGDGLSNLQEYLAGTDPQSVDTDGDGVDDSFDPLPLDGDWLHLMSYSTIFNKDDAKSARAGFSVASGDFDGDGFADTLIGVPYYDYRYGKRRYPDIGFAVVVSGKTGMALWYNIGEVKGQLYGWSVASTPDLDNDGIVDFAVGAPGTVVDWDAYQLVKKAGRVAFYNLFAVDENGQPVPVREVMGRYPNDRLGFAVSGVPSAGNGGYGWVAVGAPGVGTTDGVSNFRNAGAVYVYRPGYSANPVARYFGGAANASFGAAVAGIGDITGDGSGDLAIGAPLEDSNGKDAGAVYVVTPITNGYHDQKITGSAGSQLGASIAGGGDINGDAIPDFVVGAPFANKKAGAVSVWYGTGSKTTLNAGVTLPAGTQAKGLMGTSVAIVRGLSGDANDDILVGSPGVNAIDVKTNKKLPSAGLVQLFSGADGSELNAWSGRSAGDYLGSALASGDVNGDGKGDLIMAAPSRDAVGGSTNKPKMVKDAGEVLIFNGAQAF